MVRKFFSFLHKHQATLHFFPYKEESIGSSFSCLLESVIFFHSLFLFKDLLLLLFNYVCMKWGLVHVRAGACWVGRRESKSSELDLQAICEPPDLCAGNTAQVLCKTSVYSEPSPQNLLPFLFICLFIYLPFYVAQNVFERVIFLSPPKLCDRSWAFATMLSSV